MRYILLIGFSFFLFSSSAQEETDIRVTYSKKDASLEQIFNDLESQYGIRFSYATSSIESKLMDADFENVSIENVLDNLLSDESMEYKIVSNNVLLRKSNSFEENEDENYKSSLHIKGKITNNHDVKEALDYATISISNSSLGTYTDEDGKFDIEIPQQFRDENIIVHYLGYEDEVYKISELEDEYILVALKDGQYSIEEVMIVNKEKPIKLGNASNSIQLNKSQIRSSTSGVMGGDIGRQIQLLPGISAHDDDSAAIKIRGSNSDETLMILDGMPIYNANHYYGIFSSLNTAYIDSANIFKNTYPLQYGGKTAGLVELFSDISQPTSSEVNLNLDLLTTSGDAKIPISDNSHLSIAGRSTVKKVNNRRFNTRKSPSQMDQQVESFSKKVNRRKNEPNFSFYDVNAKYQYSNKHNDLFSINVFRSSDQVNNFYQTSIRDFNDNEIDLNAIDNQSWSNTAASVVFSKSLNSKLRWNTTSYFTQYKSEELIEFKLDKKYKQGNPQPDTHPPKVDLSTDQTNQLLDVSLNSHLEYIHKNQTFKFGVEAIHHDLEYQFDENKITKLKGEDNFIEATGYLGHQIRFWDKLHLRSGIRATYFTNIKETKYSPRILLNYIVSDRLSFKSSFSIENQVIRQFYYEYREEPKEIWVSAGMNDIPVLRSQNVMVGTTLRLNPISIDVEFYQKDMKGQLEYLLPNPGEASNNAAQNREYKLFNGNGLTRGIDIILSSGYKKYDTYLSYTLSKSEQQFKAIYKNQFFASENDRRHQLKWVNSLSIGNFTWGLNAIYVTGRPYTDIGAVGPEGNVLDQDPTIRLKQLPAYHRIDISTAYAFNIGRYKAGLTASVFNLMNTKNVKYIQSVTTNARDENIILGNESELLNRTFNLGFQIGF